MLLIAMAVLLAFAYGLADAAAAASVIVGDGDSGANKRDRHSYHSCIGFTFSPRSLGDVSVVMVLLAAVPSFLKERHLPISTSHHVYYIIYIHLMSSIFLWMTQNKIINENEK